MARNWEAVERFAQPTGEEKAQLLENEGIIIENDQIINFDEKFWDPSKELQG